MGSDGIVGDELTHLHFRINDREYPFLRFFEKFLAYSRAAILEKWNFRTIWE